jgi:hypothetical protein
MSPGRAAVVTSTDKSMPAAPANSGGCGCSDADAPQLSRMLGRPKRACGCSFVERTAPHWFYSIFSATPAPPNGAVGGIRLPRIFQGEASMNVCRGLPKPLSASTAWSWTRFGRQPNSTFRRPAFLVTTLGEAEPVGARAGEMAGLEPASRTKVHIRPAWCRGTVAKTFLVGTCADERPGSEPSPLSSLWCLGRRPADFSETQHEVSRSGVSEQHIRPCGRDRYSNIPLSRRETTLAPCIQPPMASSCGDADSA